MKKHKQKKILLPKPERILEYVNEFASRQIKRGQEVQLRLPSKRTLARAVRDQNQVLVVTEGTNESS